MSTAAVPVEAPPARPPVLGRRAELRALWRLALPIALAQLGQTLMGFVDVVIVGRAGADALAAVGLGHNLFFAVSSFGMGLMMGVDPLVSQAQGAGHGARARGLYWQGCWLAVLAGLGLLVPLLLVTLALPQVGVSARQVDEVRGYLAYRAPHLPLLLLFLTARAYLQALARPRALVVATLVANVANAGLVALLVFGGAELPAWCGPLRHVPALGARGAGLGTTLAAALEWLVVLWAVKRVPAGGEVAGQRAPRRADVRRAARVGLPIGAHIAAEVGVFALAGVLAARLGPTSAGAHQIALAFSSLSFTVALGIGNAGSVRVGWAVGARNTPQARRSGWAAFGSGAAFMSLSALTFALFPEPLARFANAPAEVLPLVAPLLAVSSVFQLSDGVQGVGAGVLRGAGDTRFTFVANVLGHYGLGLPIALALGFGLGHGIVGIWWGLCVGLTCVALALLWRFRRLTRRELVPIEGT